MCNSFCGQESDQSVFISDLLWVIRLQMHYCFFFIMRLLFSAYHMYFECLSSMYKLLSYIIHVWPEFICNKVMFMFM